jgi:putative lipoic acid-binding regulatory protein
MDKPESKRMKEMLDANHKWPSVYLFKFVVPTDKVDQARALFNADTAKITAKSSKKGNYVSISGKEMMMSSDNVLKRYEDASKIEGLIAL